MILMRKTLDQRGQTIVEFILVLVIAISVVAILGKGLRSTLYGIWTFYSREISAACPGCPPDEKVRLR